MEGEKWNRAESEFMNFNILPREEEKENIDLDRWRLGEEQKPTRPGRGLRSRTYYNFSYLSLDGFGIHKYLTSLALASFTAAA
jgi:hypothetical protein